MAKVNMRSCDLVVRPLGQSLLAFLYFMVAEKVVFGFLIADSPSRVHVFIGSAFPFLIAYSRCG